MYTETENAYQFNACLWDFIIIVKNNTIPVNLTVRLTKKNVIQSVSLQKFWLNYGRNNNFLTQV